MNFIFWQNVLSIHQSAFLRNLAESNKIILVVEIKITEARKKAGWNIPDFGNTEIIIAPNQQQIRALLNQSDTIHVFSGMQSFKMPSMVFKLAVKKRLRIGVILEPFDWIGWKGKLRFIKYYFLKLRYNHAISFLLTIGNKGRWCYEKTGFPKHKIYDWAYFTEKPNVDLPKKIDHHLPRIIFVGKLDENKNVLSLVTICKQHKRDIEKLQIIGDGYLKQTLLKDIQDSNIEYLGILPNDEVYSYINEADLLALPSIYKDGWGAVINEALMCGTPVIVSDHCGSSVLVNENRGRVFSIKNNNLETVLTDFIKQLPYNSSKRQMVRDWALTNISGESAAHYFISIIEYVLQESSIKPVAPWIKNL
jgi:glycosyltransferase involved in cell wall biosynthesis